MFLKPTGRGPFFVLISKYGLILCAIAVQQDESTDYALDCWGIKLFKVFKFSSEFHLELVPGMVDLQKETTF